MDRSAMYVGMQVEFTVGTYQFTGEVKSLDDVTAFVATGQKSTNGSGNFLVKYAHVQPVGGVLEEVEPVAEPAPVAYEPYVPPTIKRLQSGEAVELEGVPMLVAADQTLYEGVFYVGEKDEESGPVLGVFSSFEGIDFEMDEILVVEMAED